MIDGYATFPHYVDHIWPVLAALPDEVRGHVYAHPSIRHAQSLQDPTLRARIRFELPPTRGEAVIVAGYQDLPCTQRPKVLLSHGAGQTYLGIQSGSYDGGPGRDLADLFLCPNEVSMARNLERYPSAAGAVVGCPKLDYLDGIAEPGDRTVGFAFHWNCTVAPEARWAWPFWHEAILGLAHEGYRILIHGHPRAAADLYRWCSEVGLPFAWTTDELWRRADVLMVDNSSIAYEWAACGRRVGFVNSPEWRRPHPRHGLRFGDPLPGVCAGEGGSVGMLRWAVDATLNVSEAVRGMRTALVRDTVYGGLVDGHASERAARAVLDLTES